MTRRTTIAYVRALKFIHENLIEINGRGIIIDFEAAMRTALKTVVPELPVLGCLFHHIQALQRMLKSMPKLYEVVRTNEEAKLIFRKFQCLAFLPVEMIRIGFTYLLREALNVHKFSDFAPFIQYYKNQWLERVTPVHYSVFNQRIRTTGSAEAFNGKINKSFRTHPAFFVFNESLQKEEAVKADQFCRDISGVVQPDKRKAFYKKRAAMIERYSSELETKTITLKHFLSVMANINNEILYPEKDLFVHPKDIEIAQETELIDGVNIISDTIQAEAPETHVNNEPVARRTRTNRKNPADVQAEVSESPVVDEPLARRTRTNRRNLGDVQTENSATNTRTTKKRTVETSEANEPSAKRTKTINKNTRNASVARSNLQSQRIRTKKSRPQEISYESDSEADDDTFGIMTRETRNGSALLRLRKRFKEIQEQDEKDIDPESFKCILCCDRRKTVVLYPCKHQHTCEPYWFIWKVEQINKIPEHMLDDSNYENETIPQCPYCRMGVESAEKLRN